MPSSFLASALNASFDQNIAATAAQADEQRQDAGVRHGSALRSPWEIAVQIFNHSLIKDETKKISLKSCPKASLESFIHIEPRSHDDLLSVPTPPRIDSTSY